MASIRARPPANIEDKSILWPAWLTRRPISGYRQLEDIIAAAGAYRVAGPTAPVAESGLIVSPCQLTSSHLGSASLRATIVVCVCLCVD